MSTVMGWDAWVRHDATSLAGLVRSGQVHGHDRRAIDRQLVQGSGRQEQGLQGMQLVAVTGLLGEAADGAHPRRTLFTLFLGTGTSLY